MERRAEILEQKGFHFLWIDNGHGPELWMWDVPTEIEDQKQIALEAHGDVLVAGYGMGIVQKYLLENQNVTSVTTVEISEVVIRECRRVFGLLYGEVVVSNYYDFEGQKPFDCVVGDIWIDQAQKNIDDYLKFKKKAETLLKPDGKILGWGTDFFEFLVEKQNNGPG
jgi:spermidine synthase